MTLNSAGSSTEALSLDCALTNSQTGASFQLFKRWVVTFDHDNRERSCCVGDMSTTLMYMRNISESVE